MNFTINHEQTRNSSDYNYNGILMDMLEFYPGFYSALSRSCDKTGSSLIIKKLSSSIDN